MKILFLTENFFPETNAAATRVFERAVYWVEWGHEVTVITCAPNFPEGKLYDGYKNRWYQTEIISGIKVVRVKTYISPNQGVLRRTLDFFSFLINALWAGIYQPKHDVVAATSPQFFAAVAGKIVGVISRTPFVMEVGDLWPVSFVGVGLMKKGFWLRFLQVFELYLYRKSSKIIVLTKAFRKNLISRGISSEKIDVVLNGADLKRYSPIPQNQSLARDWEINEKFVVGYFGTHGMAHGLINVLDTAEILVPERHILFLFVGAGAERDKLIDAAKSKGLKNVVFKSTQPKTIMPDVWSLCDVALVHLKDSPIFSDVLPSKIFEAMAMGKPVILVSPKGEASDLLLGHGAGCWLEPGQPKKLAQELLKLSKDGKELRELSEASLNAVLNYSREKQAQEILDVFKDVCLEHI